MCYWLAEKRNLKFDVSDVQKTRNYRVPANASLRIWTGKPGALNGTGKPRACEVTSKPRARNGISILRVVESRILQVASRLAAVSCQFQSKPVTRCCKCSGETDIDAQQNISTFGQLKRSAKSNSPQYYRMWNMFQGIPDWTCPRLAYAGETSQQMSCLLKGLYELKRSGGP